MATLNKPGKAEHTLAVQRQYDRHDIFCASQTAAINSDDMHCLFTSMSPDEENIFTITWMRRQLKEKGISMKHFVHHYFKKVMNSTVLF